jgi:CBS domain-containing protein
VRKGSPVKDMRVRDVMTAQVTTVGLNETLPEAAQRLGRNNVGGAPVVDGGDVVGIVSDGDLVRSLVGPASTGADASVPKLLSLTDPPGDQPELRVANVMTRRVTVIHDEATIWDASTLMARHRVKRLPVIDHKGRLVGIVSRTDLGRVMGRSDGDIRHDVADSIKVLGAEAVDRVVVTCLNGAITLSGHVDRKTTHSLAIKLAAKVPGVVRVRDRLRYVWDDTRAERLSV